MPHNLATLPPKSRQRPRTASCRRWAPRGVGSQWCNRLPSISLNRQGEEGIVVGVCVLRLLPDTSLDTSERNDRKTEERRGVVRRIIVAFMLAALVALAAAGTAWAKPLTITTHDKVTETFTGTLHCHPNERSIVTVTANATLHITAAGRDAQGNLLPPFHTHSLFQGKFLDVPADGT